MTARPRTSSLWSQHTFGRTHLEPPPLPVAMQQGQSSFAQQMGESTGQNQQMFAGSLPHDFDHIVRSVGEW